MAQRRNPRTDDRQRLHGEREGKQRFAAHPRVGPCERKARYATEELAEIALSLVRREGKEHGEQHTYRCPNCTQYHFGGW